MGKRRLLCIYIFTSFEYFTIKSNFCIFYLWILHLHVNLHIWVFQQQRICSLRPLSYKQDLCCPYYVNSYWVKCHVCIVQEIKVSDTLVDSKYQVPTYPVLFEHIRYRILVYQTNNQYPVLTQILADTMWLWVRVPKVSISTIRVGTYSHLMDLDMSDISRTVRL